MNETPRFAAWKLRLGTSETSVLTLTSCNLYAPVQTPALRSARAASTDKRFAVEADLSGPHGAQTFRFAVYDLGHAFELTVEQSQRAAFRTIFETFVLRSALQECDTVAAERPLPGWKWCFFGFAGDLTEAHADGRVVGLDLHRRFAPILAVHTTPAVVDLAFRDRFVTAVPAFLSVRDDHVVISPRTHEVGTPLNIVTLTTAILAGKVEELLQLAP